jgi:membrane-associated phospholipid phosphatase
MAAWQQLAAGYFIYLGLVALVVRARSRAATMLAVATAAAAGLAVAADWPGPAGIPGSIVLPSALLLFGYWLPGVFYTRPMPGAERILLAFDRWLFGRVGLDRLMTAGPRAVLEALELAYLLVYAVIPAGATILVVTGHGAATPGYWTVVLAAELGCYGVLPWLQTRPPRAIEEESGPTPPLFFRAANRAVLSRGSIQANTVPSGHAAGSFAAALAVVSVLPTAGAGLLALAAAIALATVVGRYHYALDTILGILVAVAAWVALG